MFKKEANQFIFGQAPNELFKRSKLYLPITNISPTNCSVSYDNLGFKMNFRDLQNMYWKFAK